MASPIQLHHKVQKSLTSHTLLLFNHPVDDDLCEFMHNLYVAEICRLAAIFLPQTVWVYLRSDLNSKLWKTQHRVKITG